VDDLQLPVRALRWLLLRRANAEELDLALVRERASVSPPTWPACQITLASAHERERRGGCQDCRKAAQAATPDKLAAWPLSRTTRHVPGDGERGRASPSGIARTKAAASGSRLPRREAGTRWPDRSWLLERQSSCAAIVVLLSRSFWLLVRVPGWARHQRRLSSGHVEVQRAPRLVRCARGMTSSSGVRVPCGG